MRWSLVTRMIESLARACSRDGSTSVQPAGVEQGCLSGGPVLVRVEVGDAAHDGPARHLPALLAGANAVSRTSATSAKEIHRPVCSSQIASVHSIGVQASALTAAIGTTICVACRLSRPNSVIRDAEGVRGLGR